MLQTSIYAMVTFLHILDIAVEEKCASDEMVANKRGWIELIWEGHRGRILEWLQKTLPVHMCDYQYSIVTRLKDPDELNLWSEMLTVYVLNDEQTKAFQTKLLEVLEQRIEGVLFIFQAIRITMYYGKPLVMRI